MATRAAPAHAERPDAGDVTRRSMFAAGGLAAGGLALSGAAAAADRAIALAPLHQTAASLMGVLIAEGNRLRGHGLVTAAYGAGSLAGGEGDDVSSPLAFRLDGGFTQSAFAGVAISRGAARLTLFQPSGRPDLTTGGGFSGGRTVATFRADIETVLARGQGVATTTGDLVQRGGGRMRLRGGTKRVGKDGLVLRLWATGPITATQFDASRWEHQVAGHLVVTGPVS